MGRAFFKDIKFSKYSFALMQSVKVELGMDYSSSSNVKIFSIEDSCIRRSIFDQIRAEFLLMKSTDFWGCSFRNISAATIDFSSSKFDENVKFSQIEFEIFNIDRYSLECMDEFGGLSSGHRMMMNIQDDVALLQADYSGFKQWFHVAALITFAFPYAWFFALCGSLPNFLLAPIQAALRYGAPI